MAGMWEAKMRKGAAAQTGRQKGKWKEKKAAGVCVCVRTCL